MSKTFKLMLRITTTLVLVSALSAVAQGQFGKRSREAIRMGPTDPAQKELERDNLSRELGSLASSRTAEHRGPRLPFAQINEDFMHLQIVNNDLLRAVARSGTLDLTFVGKATSEIKKRAGRLKDNLVLPAPENDFKHSMPDVGVEAEQLRSSLLTLGRLIAGFAHNPIFKDTNIIDVQLSAKARRDLEAIIELSGQVKKNSERLNKAAQKSQKSFSPTPKADKNSGKR